MNLTPLSRHLFSKLVEILRDLVGLLLSLAARLSSLINMDRRPVVIIGCGAAGISACLHISKTERLVPLVACHSPGEPSDDVSKILRVDYASLDRMREA
jgi:heterodisulfide reductase subunit A-like polyferredoxin